MSAEKDHSGYVDKVRGETQAYVKKLLEENNELRALALELENENSRLSAELRVRDEQKSELGHALDEIRAVNEQYLSQYSQLEQHNTNLANLYVASYQLHGTLDREAVLAAIQEIVVNLVGSEEFAIVERDGDGQFDVVASIGIDDPASLHRREPRIEESVRSGDLFVRKEDERREHGDGVTACIPLKMDGRITGYIAIYRLLAHKPALEPLDRELFDLLATHAATALYCTSLAARMGSGERLSA